MRIVLGTRGSRLALRQTEGVREALLRVVPDVEVEVQVIHTRGDRILDAPLAKIGGKGLFVKEIEDALLERRCDAAVHSLKDVPAELPPGLVLGAFLERDLPWDAFVSMKWCSLEDMPEGARVGTTSLRRTCQLLAQRPDLEVAPLRGNVETRLRRLAEGLDAVVLAAAGLRRLGLSDRITALLTPPDFIPAVGQGVIAVECREGDGPLREVLARLDDAKTRLAVTAERAFLAAVGGGCQVPMGAVATVDGDEVAFAAFIGRPDGSQLWREMGRGRASEAAMLGRAVAERLLTAGGRDVIDGLGT